MFEFFYFILQFWIHKIHIQAKARASELKPVLVFFFEVLRRRSCALITCYFYLVLGLWNSLLNWSHMVANNLSEGVECAWFLISLCGAYQDWVQMSTSLVYICQFWLLVTKKEGWDSVLFWKNGHIKATNIRSCVFMFSVVE